MTTSCKICGSPTKEHLRLTVRGSHDSPLLLCSNCGFMFFDDPHWLPEAYVEPINRSDTGYVARNLWSRDTVQQFIEYFLNPAGLFLDYAGGFGLMVRLMRDSGYDFRWWDPYCQNLFCRGFEDPAPLEGSFEAVTAFEVLEHLVDPRSELMPISRITDCFIFSTLLFPKSEPPPANWWYYGLDHGQHVSFYTKRSLEVLAGQLGYQCISDNNIFHAFVKRPINQRKFSRLNSKWWRAWTQLTSRRASFTVSDQKRIARPLDK